ncbi:MAG: peptidoglycan DD-metalloendopeptidase family protein [Candidatus Cloacimonetes bacterium]|nr:peptidoglycan DD-metalloendopeptidase family protein [Candidatus Cloacimonadota bacterium]
MAVKKRWHIALSATGASKSMNISIPQKGGLAIMALLAVILILFAASAVYIGYNQVRIAKADQILSENEKLTNCIIELSADVDSVLSKIKQIEEWEDKVRKDKNFKKINKEIREMGIGGIPVYDSSFVKLSHDFNNEYNLLINNLDILKAKVEFNYDSHQDLVKQVELKELLYRNTPSIYPTYGRISDHYGWRTHPITKIRSYHHGLDFGNKSGTAIYATADGEVKITGRKRLFGKYIQLSHKFGYQTKYAHLDKILVKKGDVVKRGQIIGLMGNTGRSTGAHLHYEVLRYNKYRNPAKYLNKLEEDIIVSN